VQAPAEAQYDIYTMSGELVRSMSTPASTDHTLLWDLRNNAQQRVAGGVYVLRMMIGGTVTAATIHVLP
jgi:hypothetical protein